MSQNLIRPQDLGKKTDQLFTLKPEDFPKLPYPYEDWVDPIFSKLSEEKLKTKDASLDGIMNLPFPLPETEEDKENLNITVRSEISSELKIDQSLAHNGVCLTVVDLGDQTHTITAIRETLDKSNLGRLEVGSKLNLERAMQMGARLDGHIVQGHVDQTATCVEVKETDGSWLYTFSYDPSTENLTIEKGSITVNGVSLTVVNSKDDRFSVAIIPYTYDNTNFHQINEGDSVNLEFDVIGKYVAKLLQK